MQSNASSAFFKLISICIYACYSPSMYMADTENTVSHAAESAAFNE